MFKKLIDKVIFTFIILTVIFYNFHRYIFKYNSENTSPTYSNTPFIWQISKYIILSLLMVSFYLNSKFKAAISINFIIVYGTILFIVVINILSYVIYGETSYSELEYCFFFILASPLWFIKKNFSDIKINYDNVIYYSAIALYISNAIVILNFTLYGRLPALAYEGGLVRFGSFWDDPNTFGLICIFFTYFFLFKKKYILFLISLLNILLTFSFTAYFILMLSLGFWAYKKPSFINYRTVVVIMCILLGLGYEIFSHYSYVNDILEAKNGSLDAHLTNGLIFNPYPLSNSSIQMYETWYVSFFYNYFPISVFVLICFIVLFFWTLKRNLNVYMKFFMFLFVVYCAFLPMYYAFPLNFIFIMMLCSNLK